MNRRPRIERRARIFLGCEGESEQAYGAFLQRLADGCELRVHILPANLRPAGDPLALSEKAVKVFAAEEKKGGFAAKAILLDQDRLEDHSDRGKRALNLLRIEGFITIWQRPDHEGFLLRHFVRHDRDDPPRGESMSALQSVWPSYRKNMPAAELMKTLSLTEVNRAAVVVPELRRLLELIGIVHP
jgi:hypothetical protein